MHDCLVDDWEIIPQKSKVLSDTEWYQKNYGVHKPAHYVLEEYEIKRIFKAGHANGRLEMRLELEKED